MRVKTLTLGSILLGMGFGGFFDGIVLHQILQWHHMISEREPVDTVAGLELNTLADGFFHAATFLLTALGLVVLWSGLDRGYRRAPNRLLVGGLLAGWGLFNLVEGVIDHHVLEVHHVRPGPNEFLWDAGFLIWGGVMLIVGIVLICQAFARNSIR